jgi:hypothetical protein
MSDAGGLKSLLLLVVSGGGRWTRATQKSNTTTAVPCLNPGLTRKSIIAVDAVRRQRSAACIRCIEGVSR